MEEKNYSIPGMVEFVQSYINESMKLDIDYLNVSDKEKEKLMNKKDRLMSALRDCVHGSRQDKEFVKEFIGDILEQNFCLTESNINMVLPFNSPEVLTIEDKFDILLYNYKKHYYYDGLSQLILKYELDKIKEFDDGYYFCITKEEISDIYEREKPELSMRDKIKIIIQRVYSIYKGYRAIDELIDMNIDGISIGVSGLPEAFINTQEDFSGLDYKNMKPASYQSVWIYFKGKLVHLRFIELDSYEELERTCKEIYKFGSVGELSEDKGFIVNRLKRGSRVTVLRPSFCETWTAFIRNFQLSDYSLKGLITQENSELIISLLKFLVKGAMNITVTGQQGTGKTTLINALIEHIYPVLSLRIFEKAFELHVRQKFPYRNIVTFQETDTITGQQGLDISKKTDGAVTIVGETAEDAVAAYLIQVAMAASRFFITSHHGKSFSDLKMSLRNSLLKEHVFTNERIAEEQVVSVLNFDIHLENDDFTGERYIERVTECIPLYDSPKTCNYKNIIEYNLENHKYEIKNSISEANKVKMRKSMAPKDKLLFDEFINEHFKKFKE